MASNSGEALSLSQIVEKRSTSLSVVPIDPAACKILNVSSALYWPDFAIGLLNLSKSAFPNFSFALKFLSCD